jgi:PAS domain S-box-containing protein
MSDGKPGGGPVSPGGPAAGEAAPGLARRSGPQGGDGHVGLDGGADADLRRHDEILQGIVEASGSFVFSLDTELRYTSFNSTHAQLMKTLYGTEIRIGDRIADHISAAADRAAATADFERALAGQRFIVLAAVGGEDPPRRFEVLHAPIPRADGTIIGVAVIASDVTEKRRTEELLRKLSRAVDQSPVSIVITDTAGDIEYVNPKFTQVTGYEAHEVIARNPRILKSGATSQAVYEELWRTISAGGEWRGELRNRRKDGSEFWEEASISALRDAEGTVTHYIGVKEDITERKRAEEELRQTQQQLLQAQKMDSIGRLAGGIAHDFNNLLTAINGFSELALAGLPADSPVRRDLEQIRQAGERAASLTRQLLAFSRQQVLEPRVLDLNAVVSGLLTLLRRLVGGRIEIEARLADDPGRVFADPGQLEQVIVNLTINARDSMPDGGRLTIETGPASVDPAHPGGHPRVRGRPLVLLSVADTGVGMDEEVRRRAFEPFFTTKPSGEGTGLGLSTVFGIVTQSGGDVWIESRPGQGTTVKVCLPRIDAAPELAAEPDRPAAHATGTETILLVEDEPAVRTLTANWLARCGYTVLEATSAEEALRLAERDDLSIDLLLTDVVMPQVDGPALAGRLRARRPGLRVVFMSGYPDAVLARSLAFSEVETFLQKPFSISGLAQSIREVLDRT